jgi:serine protease Do
VKNNVRLIAALAAAMMLGGMGGLVASSKFRASDSESMSFAEIAELNLPAVALIRTEFELLDSSGQVSTTEARTGSGFIITKGGLIVTNRHLLFDWEYNPPPPGSTGRITKIDAVLPHHTFEEAVPAEVYKLAQDKSLDLAVLRIDSSSLQGVYGLEADISHINPGDEVVVIGYPLGLDLLQWTKDTTADPSVSTGIVSRVGHGFIQLNVRAYHGNSGGPVLNRKGEVIGILTASLGNAQDIALCTPINAALELLKKDLSWAAGSAHILPAQFSPKGIDSWQINHNEYENEGLTRSFSRRGVCF